MENDTKPRDLLHFEVFDSVCKNFLHEMARCLSESEFVSLVSIASEGKKCRGKIAYEQFVALTENDILDYWMSVCRELQLKSKYDILQRLVIKYANSKSIKWRPNLTDTEQCLDKYRKSLLFTKIQKFEDNIADLEEKLKKAKEEYRQKKKRTDDEIQFQFNKIRQTLDEKVHILDKAIVEREHQIDQISNFNLKT